MTGQMDRIAGLLAPWASEKPAWTITGNPFVVKLDASSAETFGSASEACDAAIAFAESLVDKQTALANRVEVGAKCSPIDWDAPGGWQASVSVVLSDRALLTEAGGNHEVTLS
ncbi:hypothetical protein GCM10009641_88040 [Mycobacterium cookii]|uniref:Uncharacterized protein n=1 Tax=Nocardioides furvisabuli TaxID=375542 RepID=A0ABP5I6Z3_9ACTN|nr:hypothetical protein [Nocardioides furvisabuli]